MILFFGQGYWASVTEAHRTVVWFLFVDILPMINTMLDPLIYSFSNTQFRRAVVDVWRKLRGKTRRRDSMFKSSEGTELVSVNNVS